MSFNYIANLGITRLKEIGKILRIPGYTTYKDPEALRQYIQEYLDENGAVKPEHLRKIHMSKKRVGQLTAHILEIANRKNGLPKGAYPSIMIHKENCDAQMAEKLAELAKCQEQAGNCLLDDETRGALKKYIGTTNSFNLKALINKILEKETSLRRDAAEAVRGLNKCKEDAVRALEDGQKAQAALQEKITLLTAKTEQLEAANTDAKVKELEAQIATISEQAAELRREVQAKTDAASTMETAIAQLQAQLGESVDKATRFEQELEVLRQSSAESLSKCEALHAAAIERAEQCDRDKETLREELAQCRANPAPQMLPPSVDTESVEKLSAALARVAAAEDQLKQRRGLLQEGLQGSAKEIEKLRLKESAALNKLAVALVDLDRVSNELLQSKEREATAADKSARALEDLAAATDREKALQAKLAQVEAENSRCADELQAATSKAEQVGGKLQKGKEAVIANLRKVNEQYEQCMDTGRRLKAAYDEIDASSKSEKEKCDALAEKLRSTEINLRHSISLRDEKIAQIQGDLDKCMDTGRGLKKEFDDLNARYTRAAADLEACEDERGKRGKKIGECYAQLGEARPFKAQAEKLAAENNELQARIAALSSENRQLRAELEVKKTWKGAALNLVGQ